VTAGIRRDAERWLRTLKDGGPRSRPRSIATVHSHLGKALPALLDRSARYHHLREVTRDDIEDCVRGLHGPQRHNTLVALRSLFGFCLSAGVVFRNPARGIKVGRRPSVTVLQPLGQEDIDDAVAAAVTPAARLIVALAGVHAARSSAICALHLADADPGSGRLLLGGKPRPLDDLTARLLRTWLEARHARWPGTANPHLLINTQTALSTGPASRTWINSALRGHAATIEALRVDRQLEEALATGADPLHLAATFGLDPGTAVRYASSARQLLQTAAGQQDPAQSTANPRTGSAQEA
jgi:integrase